MCAKSNCFKGARLADKPIDWLQLRRGSECEARNIGRAIKLIRP